jgi:hypothetical protein
MGLDDDGDPPVGRTEEAEDNGDVGMDIEETTDEFLKNLEKNSMSTSLQKEAARFGRYKWYDDHNRYDDIHWRGRDGTGTRTDSRNT